MHLGEIQNSEIQKSEFQPPPKDQSCSLFFKTQIKQVQTSKLCQIPLNTPWKSLNSNQFHLTRFWCRFTSGITLWHYHLCDTTTLCTLPPNRSTSTHKRQSFVGGANLVQRSCPNSRRSSTYGRLNSGRSKKPRVRSLAWPDERGLAAAARAPRVVAPPCAPVSCPRL
jgi:hypothetical protein